jgi:hypothetical protein
MLYCPVLCTFCFMDIFVNVTLCCIVQCTVYSVVCSIVSFFVVSNIAVSYMVYGMICYVFLYKRRKHFRRIFINKADTKFSINFQAYRY